MTGIGLSSVKILSRMSASVSTWDVALFEKFYQIGRSPCLEPVAAVSSGLESVEDAEWIVHSRSVRTEEVAVVVLFELRTRLVESLPVGGGKFLYVIGEVPEKFFFAYSADIGVAWVS